MLEESVFKNCLKKFTHTPIWHLATRSELALEKKNLIKTSYGQNSIILPKPIAWSSSNPTVRDNELDQLVQAWNKEEVAWQSSILNSENERH